MPNRPYATPTKFWIIIFFFFKDLIHSTQQLSVALRISDRYRKRNAERERERGGGEREIEIVVFNSRTIKHNWLIDNKHLVH